MIFFKRRRLFFWLVKAYFKKWRKTIFISFILGLIFFFILRFFVNYFVPLLPFTQVEKIGIMGNYTTDNLPMQITSSVSKGLTYIDKSDNPMPALAKSWQIENNGKTYIFYLKDNISFSNGTKFTSDLIKYNFLDVTVQTPNPKTIIFKLKTPYSPFLVTVSRPVFIDGFVGVGGYRIKSVKLNGNYVQNITLSSVTGNKQIFYQFYPTEEALKNAFILGEVSKITDITNINYQNSKIIDFNNITYSKNINYSSLVTIFYNIQDKNLSDKRLREALSYTIPDTFEFGQRNYGPFNPNSWVGKNGLTTYQQDFNHAQLLYKENQSASGSAKIEIELKSLRKYIPVAKQIKSLWEKLGIRTNIVPVDSLPDTFQAFLGDFNVPKDPDQYLLWHSSQINNISNYKNLRIDKLLEDGRQTTNIKDRIQIYSDFQKYLLDDPPATFLYFPYSYTIARK